MKKTFTIFIFFVFAMQVMAVNFDFSAESDGKTLYYKITSDTEDSKEVSVVYPNGYWPNYYDGYDMPTGDLVIPQTVTNNSETYTVTSIGEGSFGECVDLTSITIPNSVTSIGNYAFYYCTGLKKAKFASIESLCSMYWGDAYANPLYYAHHLYIKGDENEVTELTIPNSVTSIGQYAFENCTGLTSVTIPNSVTSIGQYAFENCTGLKSITIPNSVTSIGNSAFDGCCGLTSITIPNSVTSIGYYAFYLVKNIVYTGSVEGSPWGALNVNATPDKDGFIYSDAEKTELTAYVGDEKEVIIPNSVKTIGKGAFRDCRDLTSVTIPNMVTNIGDYAFYKCSGLTSVTIGNSVTNIGDYAFYKCSGLTSVTIGNSVTSIGEWAFSYCTGLKSVTIPNSVTNIGKSAFYNCIGLTSVTIGNSVTSIGELAFSYCTGLKSVTIGNSVTSIGEWAFYLVKNIVYTGSVEGSPWGALNVNATPDKEGFIYSDAEKTGLTAYVGDKKEVIIPNSVKTIAESAFENCRDLTSVTIPNSVTSIGNYAFYLCSSLTSVTIPYSVTSIGGSAFGDCRNATLYCEVDESSKPDEWDSNWNYDGGEVKWGCKVIRAAANDEEYGSVTADDANAAVKADDGSLWYLDGTTNISATLTATAKEGYHFVRWEGETADTRTINVTANGTYTAIFEADSPTSIKNSSTDKRSQVRKVLGPDGIYIIKNGVKYNMQGEILK